MWGIIFGVFMREGTRHILVKTINAIWTALFLFVFVVFTAACSVYEYDYVRSDEVRVTVAEGETYKASFAFKNVKRGSDVEIMLEFEKGFVFDSCDYHDYIVINNDETSTELVLSNVRFPVFLNISVRAEDTGIYYDSNGGSTADGKKGFLEWVEPGTHLRPNTSIGINDMKREGYTLIGWNTRSDGNGTHIGLGSRVTVEDKSVLTLYAEWAEWTNPDDFGYTETEYGITLTGYFGDLGADPFVIPGEIDGKKVVGICKAFASGLSSETLILPSGLEYIDDRAFTKCEFKELYFFNDIGRINDRCFPLTQFKTLYINAATLPRYLDTSETAEFSDKMDRLILCRNEKKLIFFAGCSMSYGLNSETVSEKYPDYTIFNMGTMGGTNADLQIDCMLPFLNKGDIFVHAPEEASQFQLFYDENCDKNIFLLCEGNPDLVSYIDMSEVYGVLTAFDLYNRSRLSSEAVSWTSDNDYHNEYGDVVIPREGFNTDEKHGESEYTYRLDYVTPEALSRMCGKYDEISAKGAKVLFGYAPINYNSLPEEAIKGKDWIEFASTVESALSEAGYPVINEVTDYLMTGKYFYDTDYHLNDIGCTIRTERMLNDLDKYFKENGF